MQRKPRALMDSGFVKGDAKFQSLFVYRFTNSFNRAANAMFYEFPAGNSRGMNLLAPRRIPYEYNCSSENEGCVSRD